MWEEKGSWMVGLGGEGSVPAFGGLKSPLVGWEGGRGGKKAGGPSSPDSAPCPAGVRAQRVTRGHGHQEDAGAGTRQEPHLLLRAAGVQGQRAQGEETPSPAGRGHRAGVARVTEGTASLSLLPPRPGTLEQGWGRAGPRCPGWGSSGGAGSPAGPRPSTFSTEALKLPRTWRGFWGRGSSLPAGLRG